MARNTVFALKVVVFVRNGQPFLCIRDRVTGGPVGEYVSALTDDEMATLPATLAREVTPYLVEAPKLLPSTPDDAPCDCPECSRAPTCPTCGRPHPSSN